MASPTRLAFALIALAAFLAALYVRRRGDDVMEMWLLTAGGFFVTVWSGLSVMWSTDHETIVSTGSFGALTLMAAVFTLYYAFLGRERERERIR
jgi:heme A synthase